MRIMTYNVHSCLGMDRRLSPERIAEVIGRFDIDVVALQELDVGRARTGQVDQARRIAELLKMESHFHPALRLEEEEYGDAILSRLPMTLVQAGRLPSVPRQYINETRGALWVEVRDGDRKVQVLNTHLGLGRNERRTQAEALLGEKWIGAAAAHGPLIVCGDFNSPPGRRVHGMLAARLRDAQREANGKHRSTFATTFPFICLDHIFVSAEVKVLSAEVPRTPLTRAASDHYPLIVEVEIGG